MTEFCIFLISIWIYNKGKSQELQRDDLLPAERDWSDITNYSRSPLSGAKPALSAGLAKNKKLVYNSNKSH